MYRIALRLEYDGASFFGWQIQKDRRTVQGEIENALEIILKEKISLFGSGRTDTGVHAENQIAHFESFRKIDRKELIRSLNGILTSDIRVLEVAKVADDFHARFCAISRTYRYQITNQPKAIGRSFWWYIRHPLQIQSLHQCAEMILGEHDFTSFSKANPDLNNRQCTINESQWQKVENTLIYRVSANRFLHHLVRNLVGTMTEVARGKLSSEEFRSLLENPVENANVYRAPAQGLILERVDY